MFKYFKLKETKLQLEVLLLSKLHNVTKVIDSIPELLGIAEKLKDTDQKEIVSELVKYIKTKESKNEE